jgi:competence protein ComEC
VRNDDSVVVTLEYRDAAFVLTGDIETPTEASLSGPLGAALASAPIRVLKVAHHGSPTSTGDALMRTVRPTLALIGVGRGNHFGHPADAVVARLAAAGAGVWRTDRDGAVTLATDGHWLEVTGFTGRHARIDAAAFSAARAPLP